MRSLSLFSLVTLLALCGTTLAAGEKNAYSLTPMRITELKSTPYLFATAETSLDNINAVVSPIMDTFNDAMSRGTFTPIGPPIFVYTDSGTDRSKPFKLQIGFPVQSGTKPVNGFDVGKLDPAQAAVAVYVGPINQIAKAYQRLFPEVFIAGHTPNGVRRERYLYWESDDSPNNVIMIEILLKN